MNECTCRSCGGAVAAGWSVIYRAHHFHVRCVIRVLLSSRAVVPPLIAHQLTREFIPWVLR